MSEPASPLRYPGGKAKLAGFFKQVFARNDLLGGHYAEPYAGGAGLALILLFDGYASSIHINDLSKPVYAFWFAVLNETDALCKLIRGTRVNISNWRRQKQIQMHPSSSSLLELGFSTFYLNRTNRSGILNGGIIGGKEQDGEYAIDARFNKKGLISRIAKIAENKEKIKLYNLDAADFIVSVSPTLPERSLVYLDPPYYEKGDALYQNYYKHDDHVRVAGLVARLQRNWVVSYDDTAEIRELYSGRRVLPYELAYTAAQRRRGKEILLFSDKLVLPPLQQSF